MKKLLLGILMLTNLLYAKEVSSKKEKADDGSIIEVQEFQEEKDGLVRIEKYGVGNIYRKVISKYENGELERKEAGWSYKGDDGNPKSSTVLYVKSDKTNSVGNYTVYSSFSDSQTFVVIDSECNKNDENKIKVEEFYNNGELTGRKEFYKNRDDGKLESTLYFANGKKTHRFSVYSENSERSTEDIVFNETGTICKSIVNYRRPQKNLICEVVEFNKDRSMIVTQHYLAKDDDATRIVSYSDKKHNFKKRELFFDNFPDVSKVEEFYYKKYKLIKIYGKNGKLVKEMKVEK